jgi:hypothetical protein
MWEATFNLGRMAWAKAQHLCQQRPWRSNLSILGILTVFGLRFFFFGICRDTHIHWTLKLHAMGRFC